jgi:hypothetical protein
LLALGAALLVLAFAAVFLFIPYLTKERETVAGVPVPTPFGVQDRIRLAPDAEVCLNEVAMDVDSELAELMVLTEARSAPGLRVTAAGAGYRSAGEVNGGYTSPATLHVRLEPPPRSLLAEFCVANRGTRNVALLATSEPRTASRPVARVGGQDVPQDLTLRFLSDETGSVVERLGVLVDRMSAFHPPVLEKPVLWVLLALVVLVLPAAAIYAVGASFRGDG